MEWNTVLTILGLFGGFVAYLMGVTVWVNKQFSNTNSLLYRKHEELKQFINDKLEYHERHDDKRFDNVQKDLLAIKLRNAAIDGKTRKEIKEEYSE